MRNKSKVISIVQDNLSQVDKYLHYNARLVKDFNLNLELVTDYIGIQADEKPLEIIGSGIPKPVGIASAKASPKTNIDTIIKSSLDDHNDIPYIIHHNNVESHIHKNAVNESTVLCTISQTSENTFLNQLFGTKETELSKKNVIPSLIIPEGHDYIKPRTILIVVRNTPQLDLQPLLQLVKILDLRIVFAFHEDDKNISIEMMMNSIDKDFKQFTGTVHTISINNSNHSLNDVIDSERPEWISYSNYDRSFFERLFKPNNNKLILSSKLPVLKF